LLGQSCKNIKKGKIFFKLMGGVEKTPGCSMCETSDRPRTKVW